MAKSIRTFLDGVLFRRALQRWQKLADHADALDSAALRNLRQYGRQLRRQIDRVSHLADHRLALSMTSSAAIQRPINSDWAFRPEIWRSALSPPGQSSVPDRAQFGEEATIFHDCKLSELTFRQVRNTRDADLAPFGMRLDVFRFDGSFLSLAIHLPTEAAQSLRLKHLIRLEMVVELEKPLEIFARLNVKHGPNVEQVVRELPLSQDKVVVEFDLAYTKMNEKRVEKMWVDLIFEGPQMNQILLRDVTFSRRPRSDF